MTPDNRASKAVVKDICHMNQNPNIASWQSSTDLVTSDLLPQRCICWPLLYSSPPWYYNDVIMSAMAPQITSLTTVYLNRLFKAQIKGKSKLRVTGLCEGNSPVTGEFPAQMASNAENVSIWWRHHGMGIRAGFVTLREFWVVSYFRGWKNVLNPTTYFVVEIRWQLCICDAETSFNF